MERVRTLLDQGYMLYTDRVWAVFERSRMSSLDVENVLRCGDIEQEPKLDGDTYRYFVETQRMCVVVSFPEEKVIQVVGGWRKQ
ncbi:hypothetical protein D7X96_15950 [Corallococcus interemptor]|uniref:DUF4258 domain-containing protein n=1 Tax=Corallococcus interemptor TaxID=2316720 RepID=A0A3A8QW64_9BACT|nr:hypothetical protein [Corallococcus interemptor]RKH69072.1 hypothetical protein D7X96_15950 [Corallococcus interemptor]